jgi:hypothetical protein
LVLSPGDPEGRSRAAVKHVKGLPKGCSDNLADLAHQPFLTRLSANSVDLADVVKGHAVFAEKTTVDYKVPLFAFGRKNDTGLRWLVVRGRWFGRTDQRSEGH